jgi:uncharacterized membrane protein
LKENKKANRLLKKGSLILLSALYIGAGINHFWHPKSYLAIIPPYLPKPDWINIASGLLEIIAGVLVIFPYTRKTGTYLIIILLIAFIPAHIYLIQMKGCVSRYLCTSELFAWIRLFPFQFILMWWAWKTYKWNQNPMV